MSRVVLITGASSGFGKLTVEKMARLGGWTVYAAARRVEKMKELEQPGVRVMNMDVTSTEQVNEGVRRIIKEQGRIDALLSNAGYGAYAMVESLPFEEITRQFDVNVFGAARLVKAVLPHMRAQRSGRIVLTSSMVSRTATVGLGWYAATKHALWGMADALRQEVRDLGIQVVMVEPGGVKTEFIEIAMDILHRTNHPDDYAALLHNLEKFFEQTGRHCAGPESTVACMVKALTARRPKIRYITTLDALKFQMAHALLPDRMFDSMMLSLMKKAGRA